MFIYLFIYLSVYLFIYIYCVTTLTWYNTYIDESLRQLRQLRQKKHCLRNAVLPSCFLDSLLHLGTFQQMQGAPNDQDNTKLTWCKLINQNGLRSLKAFEHEKLPSSSSPFCLQAATSLSAPQRIRQVSTSQTATPSRLAFRGWGAFSNCVGCASSHNYHRARFQSLRDPEGCWWPNGRSIYLNLTFIVYHCFKKISVREFVRVHHLGVSINGGTPSHHLLVDGIFMDFP